jgi:alkylhydroperoxidase family enzyme
MARVPFHELKDFDGDRLAAFYADPSMETLKNTSIGKMLPYVGDAAVDFVQLSATLRFQGKLDPALREMAIVRVGTRANSAYELFYHEKMLIELGVSEDKIRAVREGPNAQGLSELERRVVSCADAIVDRFKPGDEDFNYLLEALGMRQLHELIFNIGFYQMSCTYMETFELEVEEHTATIKV